MDHVLKKQPLCREITLGTSENQKEQDSAHSQQSQMEAQIPTKRTIEILVTVVASLTLY